MHHYPYDTCKNIENLVSGSYKNENKDDFLSKIKKAMNEVNNTGYGYCVFSVHRASKNIWSEISDCR